MYGFLYKRRQIKFSLSKYFFCISQTCDFFVEEIKYPFGVSCYSPFYELLRSNFNLLWLDDLSNESKPDLDENRPDSISGSALKNADSKSAEKFSESANVLGFFGVIGIGGTKCGWGKSPSSSSSSWDWRIRGADGGPVQ